MKTKKSEKSIPALPGLAAALTPTVITEAQLKRSEERRRKLAALLQRQRDLEYAEGRRK